MFDIFGIRKRARQDDVAVAAWDDGYLEDAAVLKDMGEAQALDVQEPFLKELLREEPDPEKTRRRMRI